MPIPTDAAHAAALDAADPLAQFRDAFVIDDPALIYLDGNSLGRLPKATATLARDMVERQWGGRLIRGWNEGWFTAPQRIGAKIAQLLGANPDEVIVADSTSVNLFKLVVAALRLQAGRTRIVTDDLNFPSDLYILQGAIDLLGQQHTLTVVPAADGLSGPVAALGAQLTEQTALLTLSHTVFKSGYTYDMAAVTADARTAGALVVWDLSHSAGAVPINLHAAGVDLAVGCTYKYLNGGPGAPAFLYVSKALQERIGNPISGWFGQRDLFGFDLTYAPAAGITRMLSGTPPGVSLALIEPGVDLLLAAGMDRLRTKSVAQTEYMIALADELLTPLGFRLSTPRDAARRGSHVSLAHDEGLRIDMALIHELNVLPDFRSPNIIRLGIAPIYTSFAEIHTAVLRMAQAVTERRYERYAREAPAVT